MAGAKMLIDLISSSFSFNLVFYWALMNNVTEDVSQAGRGGSRKDHAGDVPKLETVEWPCALCGHRKKALAISSASEPRASNSTLAMCPSRRKQRPINQHPGERYPRKLLRLVVKIRRKSLPHFQ
jgi:hypothetical protein